MQMLKKLLFFLLVPVFAQAQIPAYYNSIDFTKSGDSLKWQLATLVTNTHTSHLEYTSSTLPDTWKALKKSDLKDGDTSYVLLIYGYDDTDAITKNDRTRHKDSSCHTSGCNGLWNREHVYPQSLSSPPMVTSPPGMGTDAHNLRACDGQANSSRGNDIYAAGFGNATNLTSSTYYPGDEWIGDVARIIMYMYLRYNTQCLATNVADGTTSYSPNGDMPDILLDWNEIDPPSQYEKNRNSIFQSLQGNRNPFIDNPYLATKIWNGPMAQNNWGNVSTKNIIKSDIKIYPTQTTGVINIFTPLNIPISYQLYNAIGQEVDRGKVEKSIDISSKPNGLYFIKCIVQEKYFTQKIILN